MAREGTSSLTGTGLLVCACLLTLAKIDVNAIDTAITIATEKITKQREELMATTRASGADTQSTASPAGCPFASGQHTRSRPSTAMSREIADEARLLEEVTTTILSRQIRDASGVTASYDRVDQMNAIDLSGTQLALTVERCKRRREADCDPKSRFRSGDGQCNNLVNPHWGQAHTCMTRLMPPAYEDGVSEPRGGLRNSRLPNPRVITRAVNVEKNVTDMNITLMVMQVGQFLDHDIALAPMEVAEEIINLGNPNNPIDCCSPNRRELPECFSFDIPANDTFFGPFGKTCHNMPRSAPCSNCELGHREQQDSLTSYIDASQVYGSSGADNMRLRSMEKGRLKFQMVGKRQMLPQSFHPDEDRCSIPSAGKYCFRAGDERVNEQPGLTTLHIIWLRQHNRIAENLSDINEDWDDERLFQETRRIVIAQWQHIIFNEFLPVVLGPKVMETYRLNTQKTAFTRYNPTIDATIINEFAAAAYRFGHTLIETHFDLINNRGETQNISLQDNFFFPFDFYEGRLDPMLRGLVKQNAQKFDRHVVDDVSNHLYRLRNESFGLDLIGLNINRAREHALRPYIDYVKFCSNKVITDWKDLLDLMPKDAVQQLSSVYKRLEDIDLFPAGSSENSVAGGVVGPTFACILGNQFTRSKYGDRFFYSHRGQAGSFESEQLQEIRKTTLAGIICDNSDDIKEVPLNVFRPPGVNGNKVERCSEIARTSLSPWEADE